jgi:Cdc6-like AAA superfamily ATPase
MNENKKAIVLNLTKSETGLINKAESLVQRDGQQRLQRVIERQLLQIKDLGSKFHHNSASSINSELSYSRPHNAILIEGGRGSGKTTFLLNALHNLDRANENFLEIGKKVKVLPILDPTLIETKQNIIVVILSMIEAAVLSGADEDAGLETARQNLAEGLNLLDGIGHASAYGAEWEDASWVMSRGLDKARKGHSFEQKLNIYIEKALTLLKVDAFVLAFDDVDTNFSHGFTILETIRKYLTSPRLIWEPLTTP